jgi:MoaA/NifB/PqqE/SkfB family radical SAM enzyme
MRDVSYHLRRREMAEKLYVSNSSMPFRYVFVLTNRCNLRCSFCFQEKGAVEGSLDTNEWLKVIEQLPDYAHVTLTGGEPFLFKGFREVFEAITEKFTCNIISNGLLLSEDLIEFLLSKPNLKVLSISVDDIGNICRDVNPEKWKKAEALMRYFAKRRNELGSSTVLDTKTVVLDENISQVFDIHKYCVEVLHCDSHSYMLLKGAPIQHADYMFKFMEIYKDTQAHVYKDFDELVRQFELVRQYNILNSKKCFTHPRIVDLNGDIPILNFDLSFINAAEHIKDNFCACKAPWESW